MKDRINREKYKFDNYNPRQIILPKDEYAHVMSELNSNLSNEDRERNIVVKPIGDYYYTVVNKGFNDYIIIGKRKINEDVTEEWSNKQ